MDKMKRKTIFVFGGVIGFIAFWLFINFPIPRGEMIDSSYRTYYKNIFGHYYITVESRLELLQHGHFGYLKDVDSESFQILDNNWAKDKNHVWHGDELVESADAASFVIDKSGLPKDKYHVFTPSWRGALYDYSPTDCGIDVETAEYFVFKHNGQDWTWIRDKDNVYLEKVRVDVDRATFRPLGNTYWWVDNDWVYMDYWSSELNRCVLEKIDSIQEPIDTLSSGSHYLRNGRDVIYLSKIIVKDTEIVKFEEAGFDKCWVNDMLFEGGKLVDESSRNE